MSSKTVLITIPCLLLGGTEYQTLNLVKVLNQNGCNVHILCYFEYDITMVKYMESEGANVILMTKSGIRPKRFLQVFKEVFFGLKKVLHKVNPHIVHVQYMTPGSLVILLLKVFGVKKVITTAHTPGHIYRRKWIPQLIAKYLTESFICVSKSSEEAFFDEKAAFFSKELFEKRRKHFTIYNCIEVSKEILTKKASTDNTITIGIVSRFSHEKGIDIMISAMSMIRKEHPSVKLLIVGDGVIKNELMNLAKNKDVLDVIEWAGLQSKEKLKSYYERMDMVVVPSRFEGFGLTALESMNYGIPVIGASVDGLKEVITDGKSGVLFESEDPNALARSVIKLINDDEKRSSIVREAKKRVENQFNYNIFKQKITQLYKIVGSRS